MKNDFQVISHPNLWSEFNALSDELTYNLIVIIVKEPKIFLGRLPFYQFSEELKGRRKILLLSIDSEGLN